MSARSAWSAGAWAACMRASWPSSWQPQTRCVITLGSPFSGHVRATNAAAPTSCYSGQPLQHDPARAERAAARAAGAHHLDLQQDRRRGRLAMQPERATRRTPRTSRSTPATWAWA